METTNWFFLVSFEVGRDEYLMITNSADNDQENLSYVKYTFEEQIQYDGPRDWIRYIQETIEIELDEFSTLEFDYFCCNLKDYNEISDMLNIIILEHNLYWNET